MGSPTNGAVVFSCFEIVEGAEASTAAAETMTLREGVRAEREELRALSEGRGAMAICLMD